MSKRWFSATSLFNFLIKDPLTDWLTLYHQNVPQLAEFSSKTKITPVKALSRLPPDTVAEHKNEETPADFLSYLLSSGNKFESKIIQAIRQTHPVETVSAKYSRQAVARTIQLIKAGVPIIHSASLLNHSNHTYGLADLIVRSDYFDHLTKRNPIPLNERTLKAPKLKGKYHYRIVDIKMTKLPLRADGTHLLNSDFMPAYKSQLLIYNQALAAIQGYLPDCAYLLGRGFNFTQAKENFNSNQWQDRLGVINYTTVDENYPTETANALAWLNQLHQEGANWTLFPPSHVQLYPNMKVDNRFYDFKNLISNQLNDITQIWYCGVKEREKAFEQEVYSWRDPRCTAAVLGLNGKRGVVIDALLKINRQEKKPMNLSKLTGWPQLKLSKNEYVVDFETIPSILGEQKDEFVYLIGLYSLQGYQALVAREMTPVEEKRITQEMIAIVGKGRLYHWYAEENFWKRLSKRTQLSFQLLDNWFDLSTVFLEEPLVLKGAFNFKLKSIASALISHGFISGFSKSDSGMEVSYRAWLAYQAQTELATDIIEYNQQDCKLTYLILQFLRQLQPSKKRKELA